MADEESIAITYEGERIELDGRHSTALLLADQRDDEITSTEARECSPVELPHARQGTRIFDHLEEYGLIEIWQPNERVDGREIPPAKRAHLTRKGRNFVSEHKLKLETMESLSREAEVMRRMLQEHREEVDNELEKLVERVGRVERLVNSFRDASQGRIEELDERVEQLEVRMDAAGKVRSTLFERLSAVETKVSRHSDFISEQGKSLKKLRRTVKSRT